MMRKINIHVVFLLLCFAGTSQQSVVSIKAYDFGISNSIQRANTEAVYKDIPRIKSITLTKDLLSSLYRKSNIERTINIYGQSLIIESAETLADGRIELILRREDGRDFYNIYPTVKAELVQDINPNSEQIPSP